MGIRVTIFEDDKDLADALQERLAQCQFEVSTCYNLNESEWRKSDLVIADFRNRVVAFGKLEKTCTALGIPVLAISGGETDHRPQLLKPFTTEDLSHAILALLAEANRIGMQRKNPAKEPSFFHRLTHWRRSA